jgi:hypothetical protein
MVEIVILKLIYILLLKKSHNIEIIYFLDLICFR